MSKVDSEIINNIGLLLIDRKRPMKERFRALFTLRNIGGVRSIRWIEECFSDSSALLKHECAYCLGQMQDPAAVPKLEEILQDTKQEVIVRHEAGEALGAIGCPTSLPLLESYTNDPVPEIAETCQLAVQKIKMCYKDNDSANPYKSVDPAPPLTKDVPVDELEQMLLNENLPLFTRYQAMFSLRNNGSTEAALALAKGLKCNSALFRHEIAYVLGQMQSPACVDHLTEVLQDQEENEMVRHECAEALGAIASRNCENILNKFLCDDKRVVRESCEVALDMCEYETSPEFQYADALLKVM